MFDTIWDVIMPPLWMFIGALCVEKHYSKKWEDYQRKVSHIVKLCQWQLGRNVDRIL